MRKSSAKTKTTTASEKKFSGSERVCRKNVFSVPKGVIRNNCYAYAIQAARWDGPSYKLQPGDLSTRKSFSVMDCESITERTKEDLRKIGGHVTPFGKACAKGFYKIALILSPGRDYHFLVHHRDVVFKVTCDKQTRASIAKKFKVPVTCVEKLPSYKKGTSVYVKNADCWSHKRGTAFPVTLMDSNGKIIKDPRKATFNYGWLNYYVFCTAFCVKKRPDMKASIIKDDSDGNMVVHQYDAFTPSGIRRVISSLKRQLKIR